MRILAGLLILLLGYAPLAWAGDEADIRRQKFNHKYAQYLRADSQMLLPLPSMEMSAWKKLQQGERLEKMYSEPNVYYNAKVYTLTLYRDKVSGEYFLDAKGGFWGMDELAYGPLSEKDIE